MADWSTTLDGLPGLSEDEKVEARIILLTKKYAKKRPGEICHQAWLPRQLRRSFAWKVDGVVIAPQEVHVPEGTPECVAFVRQEDGSENAMTPALLQHHQQQLMKLGVVLTSWAVIYGMNDTHSKSKLLQFTFNEQSFSGGFDGCVAPYGLTERNISRQIRIIYEHKLKIVMSAAWAPDKQQAVGKLLGAYQYACSPCPVLLDLTDGQKHNVYTIRNEYLLVWENLTPTQAYYFQVQHLGAAGSGRADLTLELHEEEQRTMRRVQQVLRPAVGGEAALQEQRDSVFPFMPPEERESVELVNSWARTADVTQPAEEA